jgi:predicted DNA-binding transcriptional regulator AlpA
MSGEHVTLGLSDERMLSARQVAGRLGYCPATILRWTRQGYLDGHRMPGGELRYRESYIEAWLAERSTAASTADRGSAQTPDTAAPAAVDTTDPALYLGSRADTRPSHAAQPEEEHRGA